MLPQQTDPIVAIATAPGRGAVGIVRVSGPRLQPIVDALCGRVLRPREATYLPFLDARGGAIDQGLALHFPAPHSFTGEDVLELQAHGGTVVLQLLLARCLQAGQALGLRLAQPGEFTQRAFLNDKMDLAQAEAVADLIDASTETAARSAVRSLSGEFSQAIHALLAALTELRMLIEATLDFPEEEIDILKKADVQGRLSRLQAGLEAIARNARQGALLREGIKVVIAGQPNAGKSSLLNALAGAELAIVSAIAGTTRDKIAQTIQIEGVPLHVIDTAGLRDSGDEIEQMGVARAWGEIDSADVVLFLHDLTQAHPAGPAAQPDAGLSPYQQADAAIAAALTRRLPRDVPVIDVWNKRDAVPAIQPVADDSHHVFLSARTGEGIEALRLALLRLAGWRAVPEGIYMARERHVQALQRVAQHVGEAVSHVALPAPPLDLVAEELRLAQNALGEITGAFGADDLLGVIFSRFCIGK
ncbi:MAG: tRNA uridine-5-carboxymethylaminomethyl(34) synthesis GTPase MnmE [Rhodoferax sp.]|nr:tRNA uridine-5-carboxymethylaminomethyl(34) synthesis GTPase MnmE [Rhodoferax sp.]MBP9929706.1 tRNA uridine-5-carboxymethylaminomethyl(34) synthesis GTPase MnmE [Rhodoferax sp.]